MIFLKKINVLRTKAESTLIISVTENITTIKIRLPKNLIIKDFGLIDGGFGCVTSIRQEEIKSPGTFRKYQISTEDLPDNLRLDSYRYRIVGDHVKDNEWEYKFKKAEMLNHK